MKNSLSIVFIVLLPSLIWAQRVTNIDLENELGLKLVEKEGGLKEGEDITSLYIQELNYNCPIPLSFGIYEYNFGSAHDIPGLFYTSEKKLKLITNFEYKEIFNEFNALGFKAHLSLVANSTVIRAQHMRQVVMVFLPMNKFLLFILSSLLISCSEKTDIPKVDHYDNVSSWGNGYVGEILSFDQDGNVIYKPYDDVIINSMVNYYQGNYSENNSTLSFNIEAEVTLQNQKWLPWPKKTIDTISNNHPILQDRFSSDYYKVEWDSLKYLISENEILDFISDVNSLHEPRFHIFPRFFLKVDNRSKPKDIFPGIPKKFTNKLDTSLATGTITKILSDSTVLLKFDDESKIWEGMTVYGKNLAFKILEVNSSEIFAMVFGPYPDYPRNYPIDVDSWSKEDLKDFGFQKGTVVKNREP